VDQSEQKASPATIAGLLITAIGSFVAAILLEGKSSGKSGRSSLGAGKSTEDMESDWYERSRGVPPLERLMFKRKTRQEIERYQPSLDPIFIPDPEKIARYTLQPDKPEITEADIHYAATCTGPYYNLRYLPSNWCGRWKSETQMPEDLKENIIRFLESKGFKRPS
jgi:hypothetical protein